MTTVLIAGDDFIAPELFSAALRAEVPTTGLDFRTLRTRWPNEPFGPVGTGDGSVKEASGTEDQVLEALGDASVALTQMAPFTARVIREAPRLRFIGVARGGPVNVDLTAATAAGIPVTFTPGRNAAAAAEFAVGLILAAMRRIALSDAELKKGVWRGDYYAYDNTGLEIDGATIGLVGYGAIGAIVARVLRAFGAHVLVSDPYADPAKAASDGVELTGLDDLLRRSTVVSLHARVTPETRHILNADNLKLLPEGAVLVNSARGDLLDYAPLPGLLESGQARRAGPRRLRHRTPAVRLAVAPVPQRHHHPAPRGCHPADRRPGGRDHRRRGRPLPARRAPAARRQPRGSDHGRRKGPAGDG